MSAPPRILFVDDEPLTLDLVVERLQEEGYEVQVAANGSEAIAAAKSSDVAIMFMGTDISPISMPL